MPYASLRAICSRSRCSSPRSSAGYFFAAFVCYRFTWSENDPLYYLLKVVEQLSPVLIVLLLLAGFVWFTVRALRQPLGYLDDVIAAAKSLL